jgi:hypothetical protein
MIKLTQSEEAMTEQDFINAMSLSDDDYGLLSDEAKSAMYKFLNDFKGVLKFDKERLRHHWTEYSSFKAANDAYILGTNHESLDDTTTVLRCDNGHVVVFSVSPDSLTPFKCDSGSLEILAKKGI